MQRSHWLAGLVGALVGIGGFIALAVILDLDVIRWVSCTGPFRQTAEANTRLCRDLRLRPPQ